MLDYLQIPMFLVSVYTLVCVIKIHARVSTVHKEDKAPQTATQGPERAILNDTPEDVEQPASEAPKIRAFDPMDAIQWERHVKEIQAKLKEDKQVVL